MKLYNSLQNKIKNCEAKLCESEKIIEYREFLETKGIKPVLYSPGLIAQGGSLSEGAKAAGENWHAIVGRALYKSKNIKKAAQQMVKALE